MSSLFQTRSQHTSVLVKKYDTTLRDGAQDPRVSFTVSNKIKAAKLLDSILKVDYIEGGWPGAILTDTEFFNRAKDIEFTHAKLTAFGSTRKKDTPVESDAGLKALIAAATPVVTLVGKSDLWQVREILRTNADEGLKMIEESIRYLKQQGVPEVGFDAEHFFDGFTYNAEFALETLRTAARAGTDWISLCDTKGGAMPDEVYDRTNLVIRDEGLQKIYQDRNRAAANQKITVPIGIHAHNDLSLATANTLSAVEAGATLIQGTINGIGERLGNANLLTVMLIRTLKQGLCDIAQEDLSKMTAFSREIAELSGIEQFADLPFVGEYSHSHKGGFHIGALKKNPCAYEHISPELIGNSRTFLMSEQTGKGGVQAKLGQMDFPYAFGDDFLVLLRNNIKQKAYLGFRYELADASFELLARRIHPDYKNSYLLTLSEQPNGDIIPLLTLEVDTNREVQTSGNKKTLISRKNTRLMFEELKGHLTTLFPQLEQVVMTKSSTENTNGYTRIMLQVTDGINKWTTVGVNENSSIAAWDAINDALEYGLYHTPSGLPVRIDKK